MSAKVEAPPATPPLIADLLNRHPSARAAAWIQSLPSVGVGTLLGSVAIAFQPALSRLVPSPPKGRGFTDAFLRGVIPLGNAMLLPSLLFACCVAIGIGVGMHAFPRRWWARGAISALAGLLAISAILLSAVALPPQEFLLGAPVAFAAGGLASSPFARLRARMRGRPSSIPHPLRPTFALLWVPCFAAAYAMGVYVLAAAIVVLLLAVAIVLGLLAAYFALRMAGWLTSAAGGSTTSSPGTRQRPLPTFVSQKNADYSQGSTVGSDGKTVLDANWNVIGHYGDDGKTLYDEEWNIAGRMSDDGKTIYDAYWDVAGHVSGDAKTIYDAGWNTTGHNDL